MSVNSHQTLSLLLLVCSISPCSAAPLTGSQRPVLRGLSETADAIQDMSNLDRHFDCSGELQGYHQGELRQWICTLTDGTNQIVAHANIALVNSSTNYFHFSLLDRLRVRGHLEWHNGKLFASYESIERVSCGDTANIPMVPAHRLSRSGTLRQMLRVDGCVRDIARDDSDPNYFHMTVCDKEGTAQLIVIQAGHPAVDYRRYLGADVSAIGICSDNHDGLHQYAGHVLSVSGLENILIRRPAPTFANADNLESLSNALPQRIASVRQHQSAGTVLATWGGDRLLLKSDCGRVIKARLHAPPLPPVLTRIRILGLPVTDSYNLNFIHASWEATTGTPLPAECATDTMPSALLVNEAGHPQLMVKNHGKAIRMTGIVRYLPNETHPFGRMQIESDGQIVSIDASGNPVFLSDLEVGCIVSVSGTCVMEADNWNVNSAEDTNRGFFLVPRTADDIVVLSRPPWWTPGRLLTLLGLFAAALLGAIAWNVSLNRRAKAKGRELAAEQLAHVTSELKVSERTRLAVELHDALSQTLTGISMQIDTAAGFAEGKMPAVSKCLRLASRTIDACRTELKNTLWDLRSAALDEPSMDTAIRKTLCQNLAGIDLSVRFNVAREAFSDNTAHAILKIIRELATNALRHGKASSLKIAGTIDDGKLLFSVRDNGCGFDPDLAPGIAQGHFGLQGIAERLERLNGEMKIESSSGKGAKVTMILPIPSDRELP